MDRFKRLGQLQAHGAIFYFFRTAGGDDIILIRKGEDCEYRVFPEGTPANRKLALRLVERFKSAPFDGDQSATPLASGGAVIDSVKSMDGDRVEFLLRFSLAGSAIKWELGKRGDFDMALANWSFRPREEQWRALGPDERMASMKILMELVAGLLSGKQLEVVCGPGGDGQLVPSNRFAYHDLGDSRSDIPAEPCDGTAPLAVLINLPSSCEQSCVFCEKGQHLVYETGKHLERLDAVLNQYGVEYLENHSKVDLVLAGDDCLNHPELHSILARLDPWVTGSMTLLTPGTALADEAFVERIMVYQRLDLVILTMLGSNPSLHDAITGREGACSDLEEAVANCQRLGLIVEFNVVLTRENVTDLKEILARVIQFGCRARIYFFTTEPDTPLELARRCVLRREESIREINRARPEIEQIVDQIQYALPCHLPKFARARRNQSSQWFSDGSSDKPAACHDCILAGESPPCEGPGVRVREVLGDQEFG